MAKVRTLDILFLARPVLLIPVWGFCVFGYYRGVAQHRALTLPFVVGFMGVETLVLLIAFSLSVAAIHVVNQIADRVADAANDGVALLVCCNASDGSAWMYACFLGGVAVVVPAMLNVRVAFLSAVALVLGLTYSLPPARFSGRPFLDFLSNASGYGIVAFGAGWVLGTDAPLLSGTFARSALPYFLMMCGGAISSTLPDVGGDVRGGKRTTAVLLGTIPAHVLSLVFLLGAAAAALVVRDMVPLICTTCALPVYVVFFFCRNRTAMEATYKISGIMAMAVAGLLYLPLIPVSLIVFALTWMYFRLRHGVSYPSLLPIPSTSHDL